MATKTKPKNGQIQGEGRHLLPTADDIDRARARHPDKLCLFPLPRGCFAFDEDAAEISELLGVRLRAYQWCPKFFVLLEAPIDRWLAMLLQAGRKVALVEMEVLA